MKKKIISVIGLMLILSILFSTAAMANQERSRHGHNGNKHHEEIVAKLIGATQEEMNKLFAIGYTIEEMLIAADKVEAFQLALQKYYNDKDKSIIIEIGDQDEKEDGMTVRIIAAFDEKTDDKVKVEVTGLGYKVADMEKSKTILLDSKKGVVDVYVTDGIHHQSGLRGHHAQNYGMTGNQNKNNLDSQTGANQSRSRQQNTNNTTGYQAAPTNRGAAVGNTGGGMGLPGSRNINTTNTGFNPGTGAGATGYVPGIGGTGYTGYTPAPGMNTTGYTPGTGTNTTGYTPGTAGMNTTGYAPGAGATRGYAPGTAGNAGPRGGYQGTAPMTGTQNRMGANSSQGMGMNHTIGVMSSQTESNYPTEARILGVSQAQVKSAIDSGNTIFSLVSSAGKLNEYKEALIAENKAAFDLGVAEGKFDKETADKMRSYFEQKIAIWDGTTPIDMFKIKVG